MQFFQIYAKFLMQIFKCVESAQKLGKIYR